MTYDLWYWPGIPGRGEFVRLALEAGGIPYRDRARSEGERGLIADMKRRGDQPPFAPPYLVAGRRVIAQTANILLFLGEQHRLAPASASGRLWVNQLQLTIADAVAYLSNWVELKPGDLIFTGTPAGVGPVVRGDFLEGAVEGVGSVTTRIA